MGDRINVDLIRRDSDAFPAPRDADLLLVPLRPAVIELIEGAPTGGADSDSRDLQRSPDPPPSLRPPQLVVLEPQLLKYGAAARPRDRRAKSGFSGAADALGVPREGL